MLKGDKLRISQGVTVNFYAFNSIDGKLIGTSQLWLIQRGDCQRATLGYSVLNQFWRQGYGYEIGEGTIRHGIKVLGLNRIEAEIIPENTKSIKLSQKLGMKSEGIRRQSLFENGKWLDHEVFAITASDLGIENRKPDPTFKSIV
jgi:ribosomal-protein-alanine N-acetyltransferase